MQWRGCRTTQLALILFAWYVYHVLKVGSNQSGRIKPSKTQWVYSNAIGPIQARKLAAPLFCFPPTVVELDHAKMALKPCRLHKNMLGTSWPIEEISLILLET